MALVSVVIPAYNRETVIERSVRSVLNQEIQHEIEVIVVDDCSTDNTVKVLEQIQDPRIKIIKMKKNGGACRARNKGIEMAAGDWIALQDSDDEWRTDKLRLQLQMMNDHDADICFCQMERQGFVNQKHNGVYPRLNDGVVSYQNLCSRFQVSCQTIIAKREVFKTIRFDERAVRFQDFDWIIRAGKVFKVCAVARPLVNVYLQDNSITSYDKSKLAKAFKFFIDKYSSEFRDSPELFVFLNSEYANLLTMCGEDQSELYLKIYRVSGEKKHYIRYLLSKFHLLALYYRLTKKN